MTLTKGIAIFTGIILAVGGYYIWGMLSAISALPIH